MPVPLPDDWFEVSMHRPLGVEALNEPSVSCFHEPESVARHPAFRDQHSRRRVRISDLRNDVASIVNRCPADAFWIFVSCFREAGSVLQEPRCIRLDPVLRLNELSRGYGIAAHGVGCGAGTHWPFT